MQLKITAAGFALVLAALTVVLLVEEARRSAASWGAVLSAALRDCKPLLLLAAPAFPWLLRSALVTGNPAFPLLADRIPTRHLGPESAARFQETVCNVIARTLGAQFAGNASRWSGAPPGWRDCVHDPAGRADAWLGTAFD